MSPVRAAAALGLGAALLAAGPRARAEDPLDRVDGTEGWADIDTGAVDQAEAFRTHRRDLLRWEAARARLSAERAAMARLRGAGEADEAPLPGPDEPAARQARIDEARRRAESRAPERRGRRAPSVDDARPWRRR